MKKIQSVLSAVVLTFLLFSSVNALALSDLDTRFSVQLSNRERTLQYDFLIIANKRVSCTNENIIEQVALPLVNQLNIFYMGKEYNLPPQVGESDVDSINAMSMRKGQAVLARRTGRMNIIGSMEPEGLFAQPEDPSTLLASFPGIAKVSVGERWA
ncbi:MAG: hypothetical protein Q3M24_18640 [Candidatus Electrothrix aestuarii]|uniref:Uncharacterized protein n=1 Tax=Candidatus Electrothrix aestuarii TaxID=3062594 RepID=A0AAU8LTT9_9BACT|nr:hypothetical protein [Candidatus Electrothrix aestuarii]